MTSSVPGCSVARIQLQRFAGTQFRTWSFCNAHQPIGRAGCRHFLLARAGSPTCHPTTLRPLSIILVGESIDMGSLKHVLLGATTGLLTMASAQAADLPVKAAPVE